MKVFLETFSKYYPCSDCASHLRQHIIDKPPNTSSRDSLSLWMCQMHNEVNTRLNKPLFDCSKTRQRWRDGVDNCAP